MQHTKSFEIAIPKEFLKIVNKLDNWDFKFKVVVNYSCESDGSKMEICSQTTGFTATKFIAWDMPKLERYFLEAAHNNWESQYKPAIDTSSLLPVFASIFNPLIIKGEIK